MRIGYQSALGEAKRAVALMVRFLRSRRENYWAQVFSEITSALDGGDDRKALWLFRGIPMAGMGGFVDLCICRENGHKTSDGQLDTDLLPVLYGNIKEWLQTAQRVRLARRRR